MRLLPAFMLCLIFVCTGCLGRPAPPESFVRLALPDCPDNAGSSRPDRARTVSFRSVEALPSLERTAVMIANGSVLHPSRALYWEGAPDQLVYKSIAAALDCRGINASRARASGASEPAVAVTLSSFEVQQEGGLRFEVAMELLLTAAGADGTSKSTRTVRASAPLAVIDGAGIAEAARQALNKAAQDGADWVVERLGR